LEDNQWEGCPLDPKKTQGKKFSSGFFHSEFFGGVSRYAATQLIVVFSPDPSD